MGSIGLLARFQLRRRWRGLAVIAVVVGVVGGLSASLIVGSRRSASVVDRYLGVRTHYDLNVYAPPLQRSVILTLPGVRRADPTSYLGMVRRAPDGSENEGINGVAFDPAAIDPTVQILRGRVPDRLDRFGVMVNESFVGQFGSHVGDVVDVHMFSDSDRDNMDKGVYKPTGPRYRFHITGVMRTASDVALDEARGVKGAAHGSTNEMLVPYSFYERYRRTFVDFGAAFDVQLANARRDKARFVSAVKAADAGARQPPYFAPPTFGERRASLDTPVNLESSLLLALGIAVALTGAVVAGLLLRAEQRSHSGDEPTLRALGYTRTELGIVAMQRTVPFALTGALLTVGIAVALSGQYPIGVGSQIELHRGVEANASVLAGGAISILVVVLAMAFVFGWRGSGRTRRPSNRTTFARTLARVGAPTDVVVGTQLAFERPSTTRSTSRQAVCGGAAALAVIAGLGIFLAGIGALYSRPAAHGWPWDVVIGNPNFTLSGQTTERLAADRRIGAQTIATYGQATVGGRSLEILAIDPAGTAPPVVLSGHLPQSASELALGAKIARELHVHIGSSVRFSVAGGEFDKGGRTRDVEATVVGIALPPVFGESDLGEVGVVTLDAVTTAGGNAAPRFVLARLRGNDAARIAGSLTKDYTQEMLTDIVPARVANLHRVRLLPWLATGLAAAVGTILLGYTLAVGVRAQTRQLAVLRALGMPARRLGRVIAYQGVVLALAMCAIGLPAGVVAGSALWRVVAHQLGVGDHPVIALSTGLLVPMSIAVGIAAAFVPGRRVRRHDVAPLLTVE